MFKSRGSVPPVNVQTYIRQQASLNQAQQHVKELGRIGRICELDSATDRSFCREHNLRLQKQINTEMQGLLMFKLSQRKQKLKDLYKADYDSWRSQLEAKGLAFIHPEDEPE
ncbi:hypothetical protein GEMRC1_002949 [Eukaryota sp. GEM-RC1]